MQLFMKKSCQKTIVAGSPQSQFLAALAGNNLTQDVTSFDIFFSKMADQRFVKFITSRFNYILRNLRNIIVFCH